MSSSQNTFTNQIKGMRYLSQIIKYNYIPLEKHNQEMKTHLKKFAEQIVHSFQQVTGKVQIDLPEIVSYDDNEAIKDTMQMAKYQACLERLKKLIEDKIQEELEKKPEPNNAMAEILYWNQRSNNLSNLYQQLTNSDLDVIKRQFSLFSQDDTQIVDQFEKLFKDLTKNLSEAKDNVKFLTTLERQFKSLSSPDLQGVEETLPSLMNGLKLVWIISRHYKSDDKMQNLLQTITNQIADKVQANIQIHELFILNDEQPYEEQLQKTINKIQQGLNILNTWKKLYQQTKQSIEDNGGLERWDFSWKLMERVTHMSNVLEHLKQIADTLLKFLRFLGPNLKQVTGNSEGIDMLVKKVKELVNPILEKEFDFFQPTPSIRSLWQKVYSNFGSNKDKIEGETIALIQNTFQDLRSSIGAFELLQSFKSIETLDTISNNLQKKYFYVLMRYRKELEINRNLFDSGRDKILISKNKPQVAGQISWAKSIFQRVQIPIQKFVQNEDLLDEDSKQKLNEIKIEYKTLAKTLDAFQKDKFNEWNEKIMEKAMGYLKKQILAVKGPSQYEVNFSDEFKILIKEAKHLEKMGLKISKNVINISLQEKDYYSYIDKLNLMLNEYNEAVHTLSDIDRKLLSRSINELNKKLERGHESLNLSSLSIPDFIEECMKEISRFRDIRKKLDKNAHMIEDIVQSIENAQILRDFNFQERKDSGQLFTVMEFYQYFEEHMKRVTEELQEKYIIIGRSLLPKIEETIEGRSTGASKIMKEYYYYWEGRVFNALIKMILRALISFKNLIQQPSTKQVPLFQMSAEFNYPKISYQPILTEVQSIVQRLVNNIMNTAQLFWRWKDGTCIFVETQKGTNDEAIQNYTFKDQIIDNPIIYQQKYYIQIIQKKCWDKIHIFEEMWVDERKDALWDQKKKMNIEKLIERNLPITILEMQMSKYKAMVDEFETMVKERNSFFVQVSFASVCNQFRDQARQWLEEYGKVLRKSGELELQQVNHEIEEYHKKLRDDEISSIESLKSILNTITEVKDITMVMEFRIQDIVERFRTLKMYNQNIEQEKLDEAFGLDEKWKQLILEAKQKDYKLVDIKKHFAKQTRDEVEKFQAQIKIIYDEYVQFGPAAADTSLDKGLEQLENFKKKGNELETRKQELILAEKLFNLPLSKFGQLHEINQINKKLTELYDQYAKMKHSIQEWSQMLWSKLDPEVLKQGEKNFDRARKLLDKKYKEDVECQYVLEKLFKYIKDFKDSVPLIEKLKGSSISERHWEKLMKETGQNFELNVKTITLEQVFQLNLQNYEDQVNEVCTQSSNEAKNEIELQTIEREWANLQFDLFSQVKGTEEVFLLRKTADIQQKLEDSLTNLQQVASSRYVGAFLQRVRKWDQALNRIGEVIDVWLMVQKKWMYLEGIFGGSEDIKQQLAQETKKFQNNDKQFKKIMEQTQKSPQVYNCCVSNEGRLSELQTLSEELDRRQKSLSDYLDTKRNFFARFYLLSDEDLLSILGSTDVATVQPLLLKMFDNCKELLVKQGKMVYGMISDEGESYELNRQIKAERPVEGWMVQVESEMQVTLKAITKESVYMYANQERKKWILDRLGMVALVGTQIWWTWRVEDVFRKVKGGDKHAMKNESKKQTGDLNDLIAIIRGDINHLQRLKINTLIIVDVHARDIVDSFVRDSILDAREFEWESQLRFYWENDVNDIRIKQCTGVFTYGYEYQGLNGRLVITPLTDRCVMTLTTALTFKLGGAPSGPAGTGKTETVKDLAKALALRCCVTNCGDGLDFKAMGMIFSGLVQNGFWGCMDEFNRIEPSVLSVVQQQIKAIQDALIKDKKTLELLKKELRVVPTVGVFITMNPGYEGRSELPDNLKALFRPVVMVVPDLQMICEIMLMSEGFTEARTLAKKMTVLYQLAKDQLSKQYHYDFALRAMKSVLVMAGSLKRESLDTPEEAVLMRALRDMNMPKFVFEDVPLFLGLIGDLFPNMNIERKPYEKADQINTIYENHNYKPLPVQMDKVVQLYETMITRHTTMVVGPTGAGKSAVIGVLQILEKAQMYFINPKSITTNQLYGVMDMQTREWRDGLLSKIFRQANEKPSGKDELRWIMLDGDVDAVWVENMNSVMDDNKLLTLVNGDRIRLEKYCKLLFEVFDLQYASPATISRCGMVYVDPKNLGYEPYFYKWMIDRWNEKKETYEILIETLNELFQKYVVPVMNLIFDGVFEENIGQPLEQTINRTNLNMITQMCILLDAMLINQEGMVSEEIRGDAETIEWIFIFCLIWSCGACLKFEERKKFEELIRTVSGRAAPTTTSLFENYYDYNQSKNWIPWEKLVAEYKPPEDNKFSKILVPTVDTTRFSFLLGLGISQKRPVLFLGESGTAKTVIIQNYLNNVLPDEKYVRLLMNLSSRTTSEDVQNTIDDNIDKRSGKQYGPKQPGKTLIIFIDDLHMPNVDKYGTQQPNAWLKFLIEKQYIYERYGNLDQKFIKDTQFVAAMLPPGGGTNYVDPRYLSLYMTFNIIFPAQEVVEKIYSEILRFHVVKFSDEIQKAVPKITSMTLKIYTKIIELLPRTPLKFHYVFNLRDLSRIYEGLLRSTPEFFDTLNKFLRLWRNETTRVFCDKLITQEDRDKIGNDQLLEALKETFPNAVESVMQNPLLIGDYMTAQPADPEAIDPKIYQDCGGYEDVGKKFKKLLIDYNDEEHNKEMNLVLFNDALEHLTKISRIIRTPRGHALLVGVGGSGKQSLTRLSAYVAGYDIFTITLSRGYKEKEFREDLKILYEKLCTKETMFLFTDSHVAQEGFLELINNMLTIGMVPALFDDQGKKQMIDTVRDEAKKKGINETPTDLYNYFLEKVKDNLHIVLAMSPAGDTLRIRCRNFPGLISSTSINWFFTWPEEALVQVASYLLEEVELPAENRPNIVQHIVNVHTSVQHYSIEFDLKLKRKNFSTPKNYLDFLSNYKKLLVEKRSMYVSMVERYSGGLEKLAKASVEVSIMQEELKVKKLEVDAEKVQVEALIEDIKGKTEIASKHQAAAKELKSQLDVEVVEIDKQKREADKILEDAIPILERAKQALEKLDVKDLQNLKSYAQPPEPVKLVCQLCCILYKVIDKNVDESWNGAKLMMNNPSQFIVDLRDKFKTEIKKVKEKDIQRIEKIIKDNDEVFKRVIDGQVSIAALGLYNWVSNTKDLYTVQRRVDPLEKKVAELEATALRKTQELNDTNSLLEKLESELKELNHNKDQKQAILDELTAQANLMEKRLNAAVKLITGLGREQERWTEDTKVLNEKKVQLLGDCLLSSAFLSYTGAFDYFFRKEMMNNNWMLDVKAKEIPLSEDFKLETLLTSDVEISTWASQGLPGDELSIQNGILTTRSSRWPLCIDPQMQAVQWIKKKEDNKELKRELKILKLSEGSGVWLKILENAIKFGQTILFENIDEDLDPTLDPILEKNFVIKAGMKMIKLGDSDLEFNADFRLFFTTKLANPRYTPEIMGKTMVINYTVTMQGLRDQLLNVVVGFERPDKEKQRLQLIHDMSENRKKLKEAEDQLLQCLTDSKGSLLDNDELISTLEQTKQKSIEITEAIAAGTETAKEIEAARLGYAPVAKRGAILFFSMVGLSQINEMYEFSLGLYLQVFNQSLKDARKDTILENRLRNIIDKLTMNIYDYTCLGIFEVHKLMFSFHMTIQILDGDKLINHSELDFFLKGNTSLEELSEKKPYEWVPDAGWKDLQKLINIGDEYKNLINDLKNNENDFKEWYDFEKPENEELPMSYNKLTSFQILLLLRVFRPDRIVNGIKKFIIETYNSAHFVQPPTLNYNKIYNQSSEKAPIVFILSPGADPLSDVQKLAEEKGFAGNKFRFLSLGQGMESDADQYVENSASRGHWLMLQNCHLLTDWLKNSLEKKLELNDSKTHKDFRLWLSTEPTNSFPLGLLQKSLKIVTEPPDGLKLNTKAIISKISEEQLEECPHYAFKPLVWTLAFFHSIILDRRKYGKIGWNVNYDFNESDFRISFRLLGMYLKKAYDNKDDLIPWASLRYLIGEAMYGGRVTDNWDRRVLNTYLEEYMGDFLFDKNREFNFATTEEYNYGLPKQLNYEGFFNQINEIPIINTPNVFGLHSNAEITYFANSAKSIFKNLLKMQSTSAAESSGSGINKDEYISNVANDILSKMPEVFDVLAMRKEAGEILPPPTVVLFQELERFNILINKISDSINNLLRALAGEIGMSAELDELSLSLFNGFLPPSWRRLCPQTDKQLGAWMSHFLRRLAQYQDWIAKGEPMVMWMSGLHIPESYLTALIQVACRKKKWALDKSTLYTVVTKIKDPSSIDQRPDMGCYVQGLYLEGANWDIERGCLVKQNPKQLIFEMPVIQIIPIEANKLKLRNNLKTPVYITQQRKNAMGVGQVFVADLTTQEHISHWVLQGVALCLNIDY